MHQKLQITSLFFAFFHAKLDLSKYIKRTFLVAKWFKNIYKQRIYLSFTDRKYKHDIENYLNISNYIYENINFVLE